MPDERLRPATEDEIAETLSYGLKYDDRGKPSHVAREFTTSITARQLARHLARAGFVIMKKPPAPNHSAGQRATDCT
jgi:hypothetical protein